MRASPILAALLLGLFTVAACGEEEEEEGSATMRPGDDCLACHGFGAAGTVYASTSALAGDGISGVTVRITDGIGRVVTRTSNSAGNFYTSQSLVPPLLVAVTSGGTTRTMADAPSGACNACHGSGFRVHVP